MKSIPEANILLDLYHPPTSTVLHRKANTTIQILNNSSYFSYFSWNFHFCRFLCFYLFVFCILSNNRSCHRRCSVKKGVLRNFAKFKRKHLCQSLFFNKVSCVSPLTLLTKRLWHRSFSVIFAKFLSTAFYRTPPDAWFCNKLNNISYGTCFPSKSRHSELFCNIIHQLFSTGIFLGLWSRGPPYNFTEQLFF